MAEAHQLFEVIEGGLAVPKPKAGDPNGPDWLRSLPFGSRFLCKRKMATGSRFDAYGIAHVLPEAILLGENTPDGLSFAWHDSRVFSSEYRFVALLPNPPEEEDNNENNQPEPASGSSDDPDEGSTGSLPPPE